MYFVYRMLLNCQKKTNIVNSSFDPPNITSFRITLLKGGMSLYVKISY